jgi:hypothetical protein
MKLIEKRSWDDFRDTGLLWFINTTLHLFGWALVYDVESKSMYPARCRFRGFSEEINSEGYADLSQYIRENADELARESKE